MAEVFCCMPNFETDHSETNSLSQTSDLSLPHAPSFVQLIRHHTDCILAGEIVHVRCIPTNRGWSVWLRRGGTQVEHDDACFVNEWKEIQRQAENSTKCYCAMTSSSKKKQNIFLLNILLDGQNQTEQQKQKCDVVAQLLTNQPLIICRALDYQTADKELDKKELKRNRGGEAGKGVVEKAGLCWRWGGERSEVSPPSDISWAREAVTTRSAEVQVSERDDWLTRPSGTSPALRPARTFHPSFPPFPRHSSVTHPSLPSNSLRSPCGLSSHRTPTLSSSHPSLLPFPPLTFFFTP